MRMSVIETLPSAAFRKPDSARVGTALWLAIASDVGVWSCTISGETGALIGSRCCAAS